MNTGQYYVPSFFERYGRQIKEITVMVALLAFAASYHVVPAVKDKVDLAVTPAVAGLTDLYGKITSPIYKYTHINLGFVTVTPDQDFLFSVQLATYINERKGAPLMSVAVDPRYVDEKRERALASILKFEDASDWIQPFLNELPKGGLLGLYDDEAPMLDELVKKIRAEGGVRQPLVRAYAEVVFAFMMQVPDAVVRRHAIKWVSDVIAEDAVFLLVPRFDKETDPKCRQAIEEALYDIRAVSEPETALKLLLPYYITPTWPTLRLPLAVILARLGYNRAEDYVAKMMQSENITSGERVILSVAMAKTPYPRQLKITEKEEKLQAERKRLRDEQVRLAMDRREQIKRQEQIKQAVIARSKQEIVKPAEVPVKPAEVAVKPAKVPVQTAEVAVKPVETEPAPSRSFMNVVDLKVEVKNEEAKLYQNPGERATGVVLPVGTKGKADLDVLIGEDHWYQVKAKQGSGWINGNNLTIANLPVRRPKQVAAAKPATPAVKKAEEARKESTYFEAAVDNAPLFERPDEKAKQAGELEPETSYLATKSVKVGADRWFLLQIRPGETAWARGLDLKLADAQAPASASITDQLAAASTVGEKPKTDSRFNAEFVKAAVKNVSVYDRPSITGKAVKQINPDAVYKVLESSNANGHWYRIQLTPKKEGWVQVMDVSPATK